MGMFWFLSLPHPLYCVARKKYFHPEPARRLAKNPHVERHEHVCPAIHRSLQYHFIIRVPELGPPQEMNRYGLGKGDHCVDEHDCLPFGQTGRDIMFSLGTDGLVFEREWDAEQQRGFSAAYVTQNGSGCSRRTAHRCDNDIRVEHESHITENIISSVISKTH